MSSGQYIYHQVMDNPRIKWKDNASPYLGRTYDLDNIEESLEQVKDKVSVEEVDDEAQMLLTQDDNVISVFGGGSESGRTFFLVTEVYYDPRSPNMKDIINEKVKHVNGLDHSPLHEMMLKIGLFMMLIVLT